jgi:molybdenum cofactor cytidylyltransferase
MTGVIILILAAGASSRMRGVDKLLEPVAGEALLRRQARIAVATGSRVIVVLPPDRPLRHKALTGLGVESVIAADSALGMSASLRAGVVAAGKGLASGLMILPADMPEFEVDDLNAVIADFLSLPDTILRGATADGQPGHPAIFPAPVWAELATLQGDEGGRSLFTRHPVRLHMLPGQRAVTDLDTPEDWARWRPPIL